MTDLNNSNDSDDMPTNSTGGADDDWSSFVAAHSDDLEDVERSRSARKFTKHAEREEKKAQLSVHDLDDASFVGSGPRDYRSSWLDTDDVMDRYGEDFTPPNPHITHPGNLKLALWILFLVGIAGIILSVFVPRMAGILGVVFGVCLLVGAGGLLMRHKGHDETKSDMYDDGARV